MHCLGVDRPEQIDIVNGGSGVSLQLDDCVLRELDETVHHGLCLPRHDFVQCLKRWGEGGGEGMRRRKEEVGGGERRERRKGS